MLKNKNLKNFKKNKIVKRFFLYFNIPINLVGNFISVTDFELKYTLERKKEYADSEIINNIDFKMSAERLEEHRFQTIPWLDSVRRLKGLRILEIGCGNGSSTVAFAEQGAIVTAIDINENLLSEAKIRCKIYGLDVRFYLMNASDIDKIFRNEVFDLVIFMASLEHMTIDERIQSMKATYDLLPKGGLWSIVGTPNRLHFLDSHTSHIPFFHWLPDELAIKYSQFSYRNEYRQHLLDIGDEQEKKIQFYRWGRGVSYHEIEMALKPLNKLKIISNKAHFMRKKNWLFCIGSRFTSNYKFETFLRKLYPTIHKSFFQPYLDMIFEKE